MTEKKQSFYLTKAPNRDTLYIQERETLLLSTLKKREYTMSTKPWYMTSQRRKQMNREFQTMLQANHDSLLSLCNQRETEDVTEIKRLQPDLDEAGVKRVLALNIRINEGNRRTEELIMSIDPRWQDEK
jgi:hypothetical protein